MAERRIPDVRSAARRNDGKLMCGIAGFIDTSGALDEATLKRMQVSLQHRGPDDRGLLIATGDTARIGLAHTRLSILDLTDAGHQPMQFGPFSIVFNGEIYNFRAIRDDLVARGHAFVTDCDTEVILHAFAEWGIECLGRFIGMFAFALNDSSTRNMYFVRDRVGVKPLYVHTGQKFWLFGSELKALRACSEFQPRLSVPDLRAFFRHGHVPDDRCIYENCHKVDAGTYWVVNTETMHHRIVQWWDQTSLYLQEKTGATFAEAVDELDALLHSACAYRMVSDVPVGVFLSGGYDSTAVAAVLQSRSDRPISTFTIGFTEGNDEAPAAREIASILGTEHHELYCSPKEAMDIVPELPDIYDEPFADSSGIPTTLVSRMARQRVKVALSADGGDELFGGYNSYPATWRRISHLSRIPPIFRGVAGAGLQIGSRIAPRRAQGARHKLEALGNCLTRDDALMAQRLHGDSRLMPGGLIDDLVPRTGDDLRNFEDRNWPEGTHTLDAAMGLDYQTYLKDDILTKVDRATMSVGLEGREPLLDHRLAEFSARLPAAYKYDGFTTKRILKETVHRYIPRETIDRPKTGFSLPIIKWLKSDLKELFAEACSDDALAQAGILDYPVAKSWIVAFNRDQFHYTPLIWRLFIFQLWRARWI